LEYLVKKGLNINYKITEETFLFRAIDNKDIEMIEFLLRKGCPTKGEYNIRDGDEFGSYDYTKTWDIIEYATEKGNKQIVELIKRYQ
jgi:hypothetical protein